MSIFGDQLPRLLRTKWSSPVALAQELYAMLSSINNGGPSTSPTIVTPANPASAPNTIYEGWGPLQPVLSVRRPDGSTIGLTPTGFTSDGTPIPGLSFPVPEQGLYGQSSPSPPKASSPSSGGGGNAGTVISGTGATYQVRLVDGLVVSATQGQIDASDTVPAGTFVLLALVSGIYYMQAPVWQ